MTMTSSYLTAETTSKLCDYQVDALEREITDLLNQNQEAANIVRNACPKCGSETAYFTSGGYTSGKNHKHMLKCSECHRRFVEDHGQLTYYSHSDIGVWNKVIKDTLEGKSMASTAADINRNTLTVFNMRHKFLAFIEAESECVVLSDIVEADETYTHECHKGLVDADIDEENHTITVHRHPKKKTKQGLGSDKTCIITAVQRGGRAYLHTANMGKPTSENAKCLKPHIEENTFVFTDGITVYEQLLNEKKCPFKELVDTSSYDSVNHLNNVNSLHDRVKDWIKKYRNVSTIYVNRYNALFSLRQKFAGCDIQEALIQVLRWLRKKTVYFYQRQIKENIFDDPRALEERSNKMGIVEISRMKRIMGYEVIYAEN